MYLLNVTNIVHDAGFVCSREEVSGEAQRALRSHPSKSSEKEGSKPMPSFPEMVSYIQEKVDVHISQYWQCMISFMYILADFDFVCVRLHRD